MAGSLSVVCGIHEHGPRAAAILGLLRDAADEILVVVDSRMDVAELGEVAAVADRLVRYEHESPGRAITWLHGLANGDWALLIDGDEVPSRGLVDDLPRLVQATDVQQYWLPTCWNFPDPHHWLDERPWYPDFHNRLVRNDATLMFPGVRHAIGVPVGPARYLETPLYHLDCAVTDVARRERKAAIYEASRPGLQAPGGGALNERYYLPERFARLPPRPVPAEDRELIDHVLAARGGAPAPAEIPFAGRDEVERLWPGRDFGPGGYRATLAVLERDPSVRPGETRPFAVRVENHGDERWQRVDTGDRPVRMSYRILRPDGTVLVGEGLRTPLPADIPPATSTVVPVTVVAPDAPGDYLVEFDLVHEFVRWFDCPVRTPITVEPLPPAA